MDEKVATFLDMCGWACLDQGHKYIMRNKHNTGIQTIQFVKDADAPVDGIIMQQLIKVLLDRIRYLDCQMPSEYNKDISNHLSKALIALETRHLNRLHTKGKLLEHIPIYTGGHILPSASALPTSHE